MSRRKRSASPAESEFVETGSGDAAKPDLPPMPRRPRLLALASVLLAVWLAFLAYLAING